MTYVTSVGGDPINPNPFNYSQIALTASQTLIWPSNGQSSLYVGTNWIDITANNTGYVITCPPANEAGTGTEIVFNNYGSNTITIHDANGGTITTVATGLTKRIWITDNSTSAGTWRVANIGSGTTSADASALAGYGLKAITTTLNANSPVFAISNSVPIGVTNRAQSGIWTGGTDTATFTAAATLTDGWWVYIKNLGTGTLTLNPNGSELIDGATTLDLGPLDSCIVLTNGAYFYTVGLSRTITSTDSRLVLSVAGNTNVTLTSTQYANNIMDFTGVLTGNINIIFPNTVKNYFITNSTTGLFSITCKTALGTGIAIPQNSSTIATCDGTNIIDGSPPNAGTYSLSVAGSSNITLSASQAGYSVYNLAGVLTGNIDLTFPAVNAFYIINNNSTGAYTITLKVSGGATSVGATQGTSTSIYVDGSTPSIGGLGGTQYVFQCGTVTGTANALIVTQTFPSNFSLNIGTFVTFTPTQVNTGAATITLPGTGAIPLTKLSPSGPAPLTYGDLIPVPLLGQYNGTSLFVINDIFTQTATPVSTNQALTISNAFTPYVCTAALTLTIAHTTVLPIFWYVEVLAKGGNVTITPNASDVINVNAQTLAAGASFVIPQGATCKIYTDGNGNLYINYLGTRLNIEYTLASSTTTDLGTAASNIVSVTGTTAITSFGTTATTGNPLYFVRFTGALTLTHNASSLILPGGASITTAAGDTCVPKYEGSGNWRVLSYDKASGLPVVSTSTVPYAAINGCLPSSIAGTNTTASITVGSGQAVDSTNAAYITSAGYSWAASNGNAINGTDAASSTLANSTTYHMFLCSGGSGTGTFCSASLTPTFPTGYTTYKRRIFSFNTNSSGAPIPYTAIETGGGAIKAWLTTQILDISVTNLGASRTLYTLTVPTGIKVGVIGRLSEDTGSGVSLILTSGDETDVAPNNSNPWTVAPGWDAWSSDPTAISTRQLTTNTSGQIGARASNTSNLRWVTSGFDDWRRA